MSAGQNEGTTQPLPGRAVGTSSPKRGAARAVFQEVSNHPMRTQRWRAAALAALALAGLGTAALRADMLVFKDGFVLQGKVRQPGVYEMDPSGQGYWLPQGFFTLEAGARRVLFSHAQVQSVDASDPAQQADLIQFENRFTRSSAVAPYPLIEVVSAEPWKHWERTEYLNTSSGKIRLRQRLVLLTPEYARADAVNVLMNSFYPTRELGIDTVRDLLASRLELKTPEGNDFSHRFRVFRFLLQAGFYDEADKHLDELTKDFPAEKERLDSAREGLQRARALLQYDEIERAHQAGRHQWARQHLASFASQGADVRILAKIRSLKSNYESADNNLALARRYFSKLLPEVSSADHALFQEAVSTMEGELHEDNIARLEPFISMAQQDERDQQQGRKPQHQPGQLLALAVTGWLQGQDSADARVESARRLWWGRRLALNYQRSDVAAVRQRLFKEYRSRSDVIGVDEMAQLVSYLPPARAVSETVADEPLSLETAPSPVRKKGVSYLVQLPPEYHAGRDYPVLFALALGAEKPRPMLDRVSRAAAERGYMVVAPAWGLPMEDAYTYSPAEHAAVLEVLRDVRRRFQVDSDRVFLLGFGQGGNMAYDVGFAHPDLFAGVIVVGGMPQRFASRYWANCQLLPLYIVEGSHSGDNVKNNRALLEKWIPKGYPVIYVEYKGRGVEWFPEELPFVFDWMDHKIGQKKRATGLPELGRMGNGGAQGEEFQTMRQTDNRFYWLSSDSISDRHINSAESWNPNVLAATFQAKILEGNVINLNVHGVKKVTVWLGRDMVDFNKPVTVRINGAVRLMKRKVEPKLETLLDDLYQRADRQRVYWARLDFDKP
jgi:predicted esterase